MGKEIMLYLIIQALFLSEYVTARFVGSFNVKPLDAILYKEPDDVCVSEIDNLCQNLKDPCMNTLRYTNDELYNALCAFADCTNPAAQRKCRDVGSFEQKCGKGQEICNFETMIWMKGGINCKGGENACINSNQAYKDLRTAWKNCGVVDKCSKIFRHENGSHYDYYLRTDDDIIDKNPRLLHMDFDPNCKVEGAIKWHMYTTLMARRVGDFTTDIKVLKDTFKKLVSMASEQMAWNVDEDKIEITVDYIVTITYIGVKLLVTEDQKKKIETDWGNETKIVTDMNKMIQMSQTPGVNVIEITRSTGLKIVPHKEIPTTIEDTKMTTAKPTAESTASSIADDKTTMKDQPTATTKTESTEDGITTSSDSTTEQKLCDLLNCDEKDVQKLCPDKCKTCEKDEDCNKGTGDPLHVCNEFGICVEKCKDSLDEASCKNMKDSMMCEIVVDPHPCLKTCEMCLGNLQDVSDAMEKIDFEEVKKHIKDNVLQNSNDTYWPADYGNYGPLFIRLAWHASGSFREDDGRGGADGGRQRFDPERSWRDNTNLDKARSLLKETKEKFGIGLSWGDLFILAGNVAIEAMGLPLLGFCGGRIDEPNGRESYMLGPSEEQENMYPCDWKTEECKAPLGTAEVGLIYVNPAGPLGHRGVPEKSAENIRDVFGRMAMNDKETVALIGGGHAFGKSHGACKGGNGGEPPNQNPQNPWQGTCGTGANIGKAENTYTSGFELTWSPTPTAWNNNYFKNLRDFYENDGQDSAWVNKGSNETPVWRIEESKVAPSLQTKLPPNPPGAHINSNDDPIGMLTSDIALMADDKYKVIVNDFADNQGNLDEAFKQAWYKLTTRDMGPRSRCVNHNASGMAPKGIKWQHDLEDYPHPGSEEKIQEVKTKLVEMMTNDDSKVNGFIRLSWQCSSSFRITDYLGGCNGARIRHTPHKDWAVNVGLESKLNVLVDMMDDYKTTTGEEYPMPLSDLIILAGNVALEKRGTSEIKLCKERRSADDDGSNPIGIDKSHGKDGWLKPTVGKGQVGKNKKQKEIGNAFHHLSSEEMLEAIRLSGLSLSEYTALYGAGYVVGDGGACNGIYCQRTEFITGKTITKQLSNEFFTLLYSEIWQPMMIEAIMPPPGGDKEMKIFKAIGKEEYMLPNDLLFKDTPELDLISKQYRDDNDLFIKAFEKAWVKLSNIDMFDGPIKNKCDP